MTIKSAYANGSDLGRARPRIGPHNASTPYAPERDHRGIVPESERVRLAAGFGVELIRLRRASALSQARLGDLAGLRGDHIGRLERGQRRPTVAAILALSRVLVPESEREAVQERLAATAGPSLREGTARKKQAREHRDRRKSLASAEKTVRTLRSMIRGKEMRGEVVAGNLRSMADKSEQMVQRLRSEMTAAPEGIPGFTRHTARPASRRKADIIAWAESYMRFSAVDGDDDDD